MLADAHQAQATLQQQITQLHEVQEQLRGTEVRALEQLRAAHRHELQHVRDIARAKAQLRQAQTATLNAELQQVRDHQAAWMRRIRQQEAAQEQAAGERARVPTSYANVHDAPSTGSNLLLLVPEGTVLPIIGRRGEWVQVQLSPELRETGMIVRWYEGRHELIRRGERVVIGDEDNGWMHDSTVEIQPVGAR